MNGWFNWRGKHVDLIYTTAVASSVEYRGGVRYILYIPWRRVKVEYYLSYKSKKPYSWNIHVISHSVWTALRSHLAVGLVKCLCKSHLVRCLLYLWWASFLLKSICKSHLIGYNLYPSWVYFRTVICNPLTFTTTQMSEDDQGKFLTPNSTLFPDSFHVNLEPGSRVGRQCPGLRLHFTSYTTHIE